MPPVMQKNLKSAFQSTISMFEQCVNGVNPVVSVAKSYILTSFLQDDDTDLPCLMHSYCVFYSYGLDRPYCEAIDLFKDFSAIYPPFCGIQCPGYSLHFRLSHFRDGEA